MQKSQPYKPVLIFLTVLMLFTSTGFTADLHFCQGDLKSFSLLGEAQSCHTPKKSCPHHADMIVLDYEKKDCCTNKTIEVDQLDVDFDIVSDVELRDLQFELSSFSTSLSLDYITPSTEVEFCYLENQYFFPSVDIYVLFESLLI